MTPKRTSFFVRILQGGLIGSCGIMPGISGGLLCVIFGIYEPLMGVLAHPKKNLKGALPLLIPIGIGAALGFLLFAKVLDFIFTKSAAITICLLIGLILGTLPGLFKEAGEGGRPRSCWLAFGISLGAFLLLFTLMNSGAELALEPSPGWFFLCGALCGISVALPGISCASLFLLMGLYHPLTSGVADLDLSVLIPTGLGAVTAVLLFARVMDKLFRSHRKLVNHVLLGLTLASTLTIIPSDYRSSTELALSILCAGLGCLAVLIVEHRMSDKQAGK